MTERKYALVRVRAGDYLMIGNDGETLYRVCSYEENGSLVEYPDRTYRNGKSIVGTFWNVWRFKQPVVEAEAYLATADGAERLLEWERWREVSTLHKTRREAIEAALAP